MRRGGFIALGVGAYALGLLLSAPATLIDARLERFAEGRVRLSAARGTVWSGSAQLEIRDPARRTAVAKRVGWRLRPYALLRGALHYDIRFEDAAAHFPMKISRSRIEVADADVRLPAASLGHGAPKLAALELQGDVALHVTRLVFERNGVHGNASLQWRSAGSAFTPVSPLGDYELSLVGTGPEIRGSLRTLQGPLQLDGQGSWKNGANPVFEGTARVPLRYREQLANLLRLIAVERGDGTYALQLK